MSPPRVERIAQPVAQKVDRQRQRQQRHGREEQDPPLAGEQKALPDADQRAERGLGRRRADTEEGQRRLGDDGQRQRWSRSPEPAPARLGRMCLSMMAKGLRPISGPPARIPCFLDQRRAAHDAGKLHPVRQADGEDQHPDRHLVAVFRRRDALGDTEDQQRDQDRGKGQLDIGDAHDDRVGPAADIARDQAKRRCPAPSRTAPRKSRQTARCAAVEDGREDVPALVVGAEPEGFAGERWAPSGFENPFIRFRDPGSNGFCGAIQGANRADSTSKATMNARRPPPASGGNE
jgi:hypothetical protein